MVINAVFFGAQEQSQARTHGFASAKLPLDQLTGRQIDVLGFGIRYGLLPGIADRKKSNTIRVANLLTDRGCFRESGRAMMKAPGAEIKVSGGIRNGRTEEAYFMATQSLGRELSNREFFIQRWEQEYPAFVRVFEALPATHLDYRPHPRSRSAGELVALLVSAQQSCIELCKNRKSVYSGLRWQQPESIGTLADMIAAYERDHHEFARQLHSLDDYGWNHQAWLIEGEKDILLKNTVGGLLWIALFDVVHHRGQLSVYIRPMGGKVPSIYGPSADDEG